MTVEIEENPRRSREAWESAERFLYTGGSRTKDALDYLRGTSRWIVSSNPDKAKLTLRTTTDWRNSFRVRVTFSRTPDGIPPGALYAQVSYARARARGPVEVLHRTEKMKVSGLSVRSGIVYLEKINGVGIHVFSS